MKLAQIAQQVHESYPQVNTLTIIGSAVLAWLQPIASLVAIVWGGLCIYGWFEKRKRDRDAARSR